MAQSRKIKIIRWLGAAIIFVLLAFSGAAVAFVRLNAGRIYPGVFFGHVYVGGLSKEEARKKLTEATDAFLRKGFVFKVPEKRVAIDALIIAPEDPDLYYELAKFEIDEMLSQGQTLGRGGPLKENTKEILSSLFFKKHFPLKTYLDKKRLLNILVQNFSAFEQSPEDADWSIYFLTSGEPRFEIKKETPGFVYFYNQALEELESGLTALEPKEIEIKKQPSLPAISAEEVAALMPATKKILNRGTLEVSVLDITWKIYPSTFSRWLKVKKINGAAEIEAEKDSVKFALKTWGRQYGLEQEPKNAKFKLENGKVVEFSSSLNGFSIANEENVALIRAAILFGPKDGLLALKTEVTEPDFKTDEVNTYGIREKIGEAVTSFAGSPKNRRLNINVAVEKLNGLIIEQGAEFSLVRAIGKIDEESGFKEEMVIKGDKTTPEFGGGLCQIASTVFRTALKAGLPILERQNHSYRVPYYEPPIGMDATIYIPKPDFRFKNDTGAGILILASIQGDNLIFEFWGANDGRAAQTSEPEVTNIVKPPPTKIVFTEELAPGSKRCTETAHAGADAKFVYTVNYSDGKKAEKTFYSHYRPWQEVCLIGAAPGMATGTDKTAVLE